MTTTPESFPAHLADIVIASNQEVIQRDLDQREALVRWMADIDARVARLQAENADIAARVTK